MNHPGHDESHNWPRMFFIPIPMAMFGMLISFMFGMTLGHVMARKHQAMAGGGWGQMGPGGHGGPMMWKHRMGGGMGMGGKRHHHHGDGPACCCDHVPDHPVEAA